MKGLIIHLIIILVASTSAISQERAVDIKFWQTGIEPIEDRENTYGKFLEFLNETPRERSLYFPINVKMSSPEYFKDKLVSAYFIKNPHENFYHLEWKMNAYLARKLINEVKKTKSWVEIYCVENSNISVCNNNAPLVLLGEFEIRHQQIHTPPLLNQLDELDKILTKIPLEIHLIDNERRNLLLLKNKISKELYNPNEQERAEEIYYEISKKLDELSYLVKVESQLDSLELAIPKDQLSLDEFFYQIDSINEELLDYKGVYPQHTKQIQKKAFAIRKKTFKAITEGSWIYPKEYLSALWLDRNQRKNLIRPDNTRNKDSSNANSSNSFKDFLDNPFLDLGNIDHKIEFVFVPQGNGKFRMGITNNEFQKLVLRGVNQEKIFNIAYDEVIKEGTNNFQEINYPFFLSRFEVSRVEFEQIIPNSFSQDSPQTFPATNITEDQLESFLEKLRMLYPTLEIDLPTEREWEYAAKGGMSNRTYTWEGNFMDGNDCANVSNNSLRPVFVGEHKDNTSWCGAVDMIGNAKELCRIEQNIYKEPSQGQKYVARGGSYKESEIECRTTSRHPVFQTKAEHIGLRLVIRRKK